MRRWKLDRAVVRMALGAIIHAAEQIIRRIQVDVSDEPTFEDLVPVYVAIWDLHAELGQALQILDPYIVDLHPDRYRPYPLSGSGVLRVRGGNEKVVYDNPLVVSSLAKAIVNQSGISAIVNHDGEPVEPEAVVEALTQIMAKATGALAPSFNSWRKTVAKELGVDLNRFSRKEVTSYRPSIEGRSPEDSTLNSSANDLEAERLEGVDNTAEAS